MYQMLVNIGVAIGWGTILVGWHRTGYSEYGHKLSGEEVVAIAADRIGAGTEEQDRLAALLANADPTDWQTLDRYLEELSEGEKFSSTQELRKWRLAELEHLLDVGVEAALRTQYEAHLELYETFADFWMSWHELLGSKGTPSDCGYGSPVEEMVLAHQLWAAQEKTDLKAELHD